MRLIVIAVTAALVGYGAGFLRAERRCEAASLRAELSIARADLAASASAEASARAQAAELEESDHKNQEKVGALVEELNRRQGRACGLSDGDARRLRAIR